MTPPEVEYVLAAHVDGELVYRQTSQSLEVVEQSLLTAGNAVAAKLKQDIEDLKAGLG